MFLLKSFQQTYLTSFDDPISLFLKANSCLSAWWILRTLNTIAVPIFIHWSLTSVHIQMDSWFRTGIFNSTLHLVTTQSLWIHLCSTTQGIFSGQKMWWPCLIFKDEWHQWSASSLCFPWIGNICAPVSTARTVTVLLMKIIVVHTSCCHRGGQIYATILL